MCVINLTDILRNIQNRNKTITEQNRQKKQDRVHTFLLKVYISYIICQYTSTQ